MIWKKYEDQTRDEALQNKFTAYLHVAVKRTRCEYISKMNRINCFVDKDLSGLENENYDLEVEALKNFPIRLQIQNEALFLAIAELSERERYIFFQRVLNDTPMEEMALQLGLTYKGIATIYYRTIKKLKAKMQGGIL